MKTLLLSLKTLINNGACVEGGRREEKRYAIIAIFFALAALVLSVLPLYVTNITTQGSNFVSSTRYDYDYGTIRFNETVYKANLKMTVNKEPENSDHPNENCLSVSTSEWENLFADTKCHRFEYYSNDGVRKFEAYCNQTHNDTEFNTYVTNLINNVNPITGGTLDGDEGVGRTTSFIVFGRYSVVSYLYQPGTTTAKGTLQGDYKHTDIGTDLVQFAKVTVDGKTLEPGNEDQAKYLPAVWENWTNFYNQSYINFRDTYTWRTVGIMFGVDAAIIIIMGLLIFLLTRGKNNPFRIYTFWETQKIAYYASLAPGILAMALGFIPMFSTYAIMFFVMFMGVRIMFMSMKTLRVGGGTAPAPTKK